MPMKMLAPGRNFLFPFSHMKPDPSSKTAGAIIGKKSVDNADQCLEWPVYLKCLSLKCRGAAPSGNWSRTLTA